jgi:hypothetical protein
MESFGNGGDMPPIHFSDPNFTHGEESRTAFSSLSRAFPRYVFFLTSENATLSLRCPVGVIFTRAGIALCETACPSTPEIGRRQADYTVRQKPTLSHLAC